MSKDIKINLKNASKILNMLTKIAEDKREPYCPCKPQERTEDNICPCKTFLETKECCCSLFVERTS